MPVSIQNSLTRTKEEFCPAHPPVVSMYTCGVTVYDDCHIGHARSLYIFEVIRRYLAYRGYTVTLVRNITDIDDKIIKRANELKVPWDGLVAKYIGRYYEDLAAMGIPKADIEPRATENIPEMLSYIKRLIDKGYAYPTKSGVYFNVRKFKEYGKLSGQSVDQMLVGVRKGSDEEKEDPLDFALWKASKEGEPFWPSPWGNGRPGWHIECSVMSQKYLKTETLDIHAGGRDLIFPHHENEVCQAEALTGKQFAKYWIHHGLLTINGQKMSKSLGNFVTIKEFLAKHKNPDYLKLLFLSAHYSSPVDYSEDKIQETKQAYEHFTILLSKIDREFGTRDIKVLPDWTHGNIDDFKAEFIKAMDDDFNTPIALGVLFSLAKECNKLLADKGDNTRGMLQYAVATLLELSSVLGLSLTAAGEDMSDANVTVAIAMRKRYKENKMYKEADEVRKTLESQGVILEDAKDGTTTWRRKL